MRSVTAQLPAAADGYTDLSMAPADVLFSWIQLTSCSDSDQQERMGNAAVSGTARPATVDARCFSHSAADGAAALQGELAA